MSKSSNTGAHEAAQRNVDDRYQPVRNEIGWRRMRDEQPSTYPYHHYASQRAASPEAPASRYGYAAPSTSGHFESGAITSPQYERRAPPLPLPGPPSRTPQLQPTSLPVPRAEYAGYDEEARRLPRSQSDRMLGPGRALERDYSEYPSSSSLYPIPRPSYQGPLASRYGSSQISHTSGAMYSTSPPVLRRSPPALPAPYSSSHREGPYLPAASPATLSGPYRPGEAFARYQHPDAIDPQDGGGAGPSETGGKRFRISRACQHCKTRKTRCDAIGILAHHANADRRLMDPYGRHAPLKPPTPSHGAGTSESGSPEEGSAAATAPDMIVIQPCTNCLRANIECVYSRKQLKRGPSKGYVKQLEKRLDSLEQSLLDRNAAGEEGDQITAQHGLSETSREDTAKAKPEERLANLENLLQAGQEPPSCARPLSTFKKEMDASPTNSQQPPIPSELTSNLTFKLYNNVNSGLSVLARPFFTTKLHRTLPILGVERRSSDPDLDTLTKNRQRAIMLLLDPLTSAPSSLSKHREALHRVVGESMSANVSLSPQASPLLKTRPGDWPTEVVAEPSNLDGQLARSSDAALIQGESLLLCYLDTLRLGEPSVLMLSAASHLLRKHGKTAKRQHAALTALDCWHAAAMGSPFEFSLDGGKREGSRILDDDLMGHLGTDHATLTGDESISKELLRSAAMLQIYQNEVDAAAGDSRRLTRDSLFGILRRVGLEDDHHKSQPSDEPADIAGVRDILRTVLFLHHQLRTIPDAGWECLDEQLTTAAHLVDRLNHNHGVLVLLQTFVGPAILGMLAAQLAWSAFAILASSQQAHGEGTSSNILDRAQRKARQCLQSLSSLALSAHGPSHRNERLLSNDDETQSVDGSPARLKTQCSSLAPICARIALYAQHWLDVLDKHVSDGSRDDDTEHYRRQADALARGVHDYGALGLVLASTGAEPAWQLWKEHHSRGSSSPTTTERAPHQSPSI